MECLSGGDGCPTLDEAIDFIQEETGGYLSDEVLEVIYNCAEDILAQLGFGGARKQMDNENYFQNYVKKSIILNY